MEIVRVDMMTLAPLSYSLKDNIGVHGACKNRSHEYDKQGDLDRACLEDCPNESDL